MKCYAETGRKHYYCPFKFEVVGTVAGGEYAPHAVRGSSPTAWATYRAPLRHKIKTNDTSAAGHL